MPNLNSTQLFILALLSLAILGAVAYFDPSYRPLLVGVVLSVLAAAGLYHASATGAAHVVSGINLGVPLQATIDAAPASAAAQPVEAAG